MGFDLVQTPLPDLRQLWASTGPEQQKSINIRPKYGTDVVQSSTKTVFSVETEGHFFFNVPYFNVFKLLIKFWSIKNNNDNTFHLGFIEVPFINT